MSAVRVLHLPDPGRPGRALCGAWMPHWTVNIDWPPCRHCHLQRERSSLYQQRSSMPTMHSVSISQHEHRALLNAAFPNISNRSASIADVIERLKLLHELEEAVKLDVREARVSSNIVDKLQDTLIQQSKVLRRPGA